MLLVKKKKKMVAGRTALPIILEKYDRDCINNDIIYYYNMAAIVIKFKLNDVSDT